MGHKRNYGVMRFRGKQEGVHRVAFKLKNPDVNVDGLLICHCCDTPRCFNPEHLFAGSYKDNSADMMRKQRHSYNFASLAKEQIPDIRRRLASGEKCQEIADRYGVGFQAIYYIKSGKTWKHIP